jgi:hypothetical protein
MKALLDNEYAPVTFHCGFVESPFEAFSAALVSWHKEVEAKRGGHTEMSWFSASLPEALLRLEPLRTPTDRDLFIETQSGWTATFSNGLRVNSAFTGVSYLPKVLKCRGLDVACVPDRRNKAGRDGLQIYGVTVFTLYGPEETDWLNRIRHISLTNDAGIRRKFVAEGQVQPFELTENYKAKKLSNRFTPEMLEAYCKALDIDVFSSGFYGGKCLLTRNMSMRAPGPTMSIAEARSHLYL